MKLVTLESILSHKTSTLNSADTIAQALSMMDVQAISSVIIVNDENRPVGIFTEHDALRVVAETLDTQSPLSAVMTAAPFCVSHTMQLHDAYILMEEKGFRHLVVTDEQGCFAGVVSEGDFLRHIGFEHLAKFKIVAEAMSKSPLIVESGMSLVEAAALMSERKCDYAVVLEGVLPVGLITERDIARRCAQEESLYDETVRHLLHKISTLSIKISRFMKRHPLWNNTRFISLWSWTLRGIWPDCLIDMMCCTRFTVPILNF
jgi:CBS domain-containing protein